MFDRRCIVQQSAEAIYIVTMRILIALIVPVLLLTACESSDGKRSSLETFFMNLGQIAYDSARESVRPEKPN